MTTTIHGVELIPGLDTLGTAGALVAVRDERRRQRRLWPDSHELTAGEWLAILVEEVGEVASAQKGDSTKDLAVELVQVAAVAVAMLEELTR